MNRFSLVVVLIATAMPVTGVEPTSADKRSPAPADARADRTTRAVAPAAGKTKQTITSSSNAILSSDAVTMLPSPYVLYPDLVPQGTPYVSSCSWNPSAGETCESQCPPIEINLPFGTKNASNRALNGPGTVKVLLRPSGQVLKQYTFNGLPAQGHYMPASIKRLLVRCNTGTSVGTPPATHDLIVETAVNEVSKDNNAKPLHIGPNDQLVLP